MPHAFAQRVRPLAGFRIVLVHAYLTVEAPRVHEVLTMKLPSLREFASYIERPNS